VTRLPLDIAAMVAGVKPGTVRRWVHDGHVTRHRDGYDLDELIAYRDSRDLHALAARAGVTQPETLGVSLGGQQTRV
jgi:hypothetical protein